MKKCLQKTVGRARLTYFELITHLAAIQDVVNGRPITYVNSELEDVEPLTPNKILKLHTNPRLRLVHDCDHGDPLWTQTPSSYHEDLNQTLMKQEELLESYVNMWYSQYLLGLRETSRDVFQADWVDRISVGDIVLIDTRDRPRVHWQMGRVIQLIHSNDGHVRQVVLKTGNGEGRYSTRLLYPLEIQSTHSGTSDCKTSASSDDDVSNGQTDVVTDPPSGAPQRPARPRRQAALKQDQLVKNLVQSGSL